MFENPNSKHQIPNKFEIPNPKVPNVDFCHIPARAPWTLRGLGFGAWDLFGIWSLEFGIWLRLGRVTEIRANDHEKD
jgi:hypothetical protein